MTFSITVTAEVRSQVSASVESTSATIKLTGTDGTSYEPTLWTLEKVGGSSKIVENKDFATVSDEIVKLSETLNPTETPSFSYKLSWSWAFDEDDDEDSNSLYDTILGALMAEDEYKSYTSNKPYETTSGIGDNEGTQIRIYTSDSGLVVQSLAKGEDWTTNSDNIVTYTADTTVTLDLKITVQQIQGTAA